MMWQRLVVAGLSISWLAGAARAGQAPFAMLAPNLPVSHSDRVYAAEQFSNTVSVIDPASNELLGVLRLGDPQPGNFSPLYKGQVLVHGMGFSPDRRTIAVVSIGSNSVSFIDTNTNVVKATTYVGRSPHEAFYSPDGHEVWVTVRGESYLAVLDANSYKEIGRINTPNGPGMTIFSPDGKYGYVCSSFTPELVVFDAKTHREAGRVAQPSPFCPNIAASPDGKQVWYTLKDIGKTVVINARPPFNTLKILDTGPITNHVNFADNAKGKFAYVTVGGLNEVLVFRRSDFAEVATIPVGELPHGIWPSGDGSRVYVGLENRDAMDAIDTLENRVIATVPIGQAPQAVTYVPGAVASGGGRENLQPLGLAGEVAHISLAAPGAAPATSVSLFDQGLVQLLQAAVTGLEPRSPYVLALSTSPDGSGALQPLASFMTNPAGGAIVNTAGPIRQLANDMAPAERRFLVIAPGRPDKVGAPAQIQSQVRIPSK
jgi:YVTN family beta-propeller protein